MKATTLEWIVIFAIILLMIVGAIYFFVPL